MSIEITKEQVELRAIIDAVCYWLGYQFKIGREQLIHEASLRYPIADAITAKGTIIDRIVLEQLHPVFKSKKIDIVVYSEDVVVPTAEKDDSKIEKVFELKLAKNKTGEEGSEEHQRVFNDVVRLAYYNILGGGKKKDCYFFMCGKYDEFKTYFVGQKNAIQTENGRNNVPMRLTKPDAASSFLEKWEANGLYKDWFAFEMGGEQEIVFEKNDNSKWGLKNFCNEYKLRKGNWKSQKGIKIKTTCCAITHFTEKNIDRTHAAGIWKIEGVEILKINSSE